MSIYRGSYQPHAPATGEVLAGALRSAQEMDDEAGLFVAQWWRPLQLRTPTQQATEPTGTVVVWQARTYLPAHWIGLRAHVVFAVDGDSRADVTHSIAVDSAAGTDVTRRVEGEPDFDSGLWLPGHYGQIYETEVRSDELGSSAGSVAELEVRVSVAKINQAGGTPDGRAGYVALGVTVWGVVFGG